MLHGAMHQMGPIAGQKFVLLRDSASFAVMVSAAAACRHPDQPAHDQRPLHHQPGRLAAGVLSCHAPDNLTKHSLVPFDMLGSAAGCAVAVYHDGTHIVHLCAYTSHQVSRWLTSVWFWRATDEAGIENNTLSSPHVLSITPRTPVLHLLYKTPCRVQAVLTGGRETGTLEQQAGGAEPVQPHAPVDRLRSLALNRSGSAASYRCRCMSCTSASRRLSITWKHGACGVCPVSCAGCRYIQSQPANLLRVSAL